MISQSGAESDPQQEYADFLQGQARKAGLTLRQLSEAFDRAQKEREQKAAAAGSLPGSPVGVISVSKSELGRILKGQSVPRQLLPFTRQFLAITSRVGQLTENQHRDLVQRAERLIDALAKRAVDHNPARIPSPRPSSALEEGSHAETIAALRLEVELERARHTETRLRYALNDAQFLMATLWRIISALRDLISGQDALEARAYHDRMDRAELTRLHGVTEQALAYKAQAHEEADRTAHRLRELEGLWERARAEKQRLALHPEAAGLVRPSQDSQTTPLPAPPQDFLAQPVLDDIAGALSRARDINTEAELTVRDLEHAVMAEGPVIPNEELDVLVAASRLTQASHRALALESLVGDWPEREETRDAVLRLIHDRDGAVQRAALNQLGRLWPGYPDAREALLEVVQGSPEPLGQQGSIRAAAAELLVQGWPNDPGVRGVLLQLTLDTDHRVRGTAVEGLGNTYRGDAEVRDVLIRALDDDEESVWHLAGLALAGGWPGNAEVRNAMIRAFNTDRDSGLHLGRCLATGWPGDPDVRDLLLRLARNDDERIRFSAVATMAVAWQRDVDIAEALVGLTFTEGESVRMSAESALTEVWHWADAVRDRLFSLTSHTDPRTRIGAAEKLALLGRNDGNVHDTLVRLTTDDVEAVRISAAQSLVREWPDEPAGQTVLLQLATDLGAYDVDLRDALIRLTDSGDETVRSTAAQKLMRVWPDDPAVKKALQRFTQERDGDVNETTRRHLAP